MKAIILILCFFIAFITSANAGAIYNCIDSDGSKTITDKPIDGMKCTTTESYRDTSPLRPVITTNKGKSITRNILPSDRESNKDYLSNENSNLGKAMQAKGKGNYTFMDMQVTQTFYCKDYISKSIKNKFPYNGLTAAQHMIAACMKQEIVSNLSEQEKNHLKKLSLKLNDAKAKLSQKELSDLKEKEIAVNENGEWLKKEKKVIEPKDISQLSTKEMKSLDEELRLIFKKMINALKNGNIELALTFFDHRTKSRHKEMFSALSPDQLKEVVSEYRELHFKQILSNEEVSYEITTIQDGKKMSYPLTFSQDQGKWKIYEF